MGDASATSDPSVSSSVPTERNDPKILLFTYIYGEQAANKGYLRLFVESARRSGIELALVGYPGPPFHLPPNVRYIPVTWDELVDRIKFKILNGTEPTDLRATDLYYKVNDFKPVFAHLFPEIVHGYDWWGSMDNDLVLGNMRKFLNQQLLSQFDIMDALQNEYTAGHLTLYRNTVVINTLFRLAQRPLHEIFGTSQHLAFDEWGGKLGRKEPHYNSTMAGIVHRHHERLGLRWHGMGHYVWDYDWYKNDTSLGELTLKKLSPHGQELRIFPNDHPDWSYEVMFCHFERSKKILEQVLSDKHLLQELVDRGEYRINFVKGPSVLPLNWLDAITWPF